MLHRLQTIWHWVSEIGITKKLDRAESQKVRLLNQILTITLPIFLLVIVIELTKGGNIGVLSTLILLLLTLLTFVLHHLGHFFVARIYILLILTAGLMGLEYLYGRELGGEYALFAIGLGVVIFLEKRLGWQLFMGLVVLSAYEFIRWSFRLPDHELAHLLSPYSDRLVFVASMLTGVMISSMFINQRNRIESRMEAVLEDIQEKNEALEKANHELEHFAYVASHDLKTPLRNINNFLGLIEKRLSEAALSEVGEYLKVASNNTRHMYFLIEDILSYASLNNQRQEQVVDLNKMVRRVQIKLMHFLNENKAKIQVDPLPMLKGDPVQLELLFQNLIENGIKYNDSEIPEIDIRHEMKEKVSVITFCDNGIGIPEPYRDKIFDMFYRLHTQERYSGTGIGLAICQKIVEQHGGTISLDSKEEEGSCFCINLPLRKLN